MCEVHLRGVASFKYIGFRFPKMKTSLEPKRHWTYTLHNFFSLFKQTEIPTSEKC